jgi:hypothetical protein
VLVYTFSYILNCWIYQGLKKIYFFVTHLKFSMLFVYS